MRVCTNCVMDESDSKITFDDQGVCDHCRDFQAAIEADWKEAERSETDLDKMAEKIRKDGEGRDFDCLLGMSGGLDSSYMLHMAVTRMGLRPLVFHVDGGWNTDLAVQNIEQLIEGLNLDLYTEVIDWEEMRDLQLAYFKSGVPHIDLPQDLAYVSTLDKFAAENDVTYIMNGGNISTECVRNPLEYFYYGTDPLQFYDIRRQHSAVKLKSFPRSSILKRKIYMPYVKGVQVVKPLNTVRYRRQEAIDTLHEAYGWEWYGQKHFESRFTRFYEGYWLPEKFGFDTRRVQFSSLILTGQMNRDEALAALESPALDAETVKHEFEYVATKLGITIDQLQGYFDMPNKGYEDYWNSRSVMNLGAKVRKRLGLETTIKR